MLHVVLTGGGSAGHVAPALAVVRASAERPSPSTDFSWDWIGAGAPEQELVAAAGIPFHRIPAGKLRRYASWSNLLDPFRVLGGIVQAWRILGTLRPDVVFSKGGFVAVPVGIAARLRGIPLVTHESDATPGLATRILARVAREVLLGQEARVPWSTPTTVVGNPVRPEILHGNAARARTRFGIPDGRPVILVTGGSLGAQALNALVPPLVGLLDGAASVLHQTGEGKAVPFAHADYVQRPFLSAEAFGDALALADVVIARAGAGTIAELASTGKAALFVPLPKSASRGDQLRNAAHLAARGAAIVCEQETLTPSLLAEQVRSLVADAPRRTALGAALRSTVRTDAAERILARIEAIGGKR